jgi:uncharacterized protein YqgC (DUF456 family)
MRLVLRVLLFEFTVSSALLLAGWIRVAVQVWPFAMDSLKAGFGGRTWGRTWARTWRAGLGLLIGLPVVGGWPVLLSPVLGKYTSGDWLTIAILWWVLAGAIGALLLAAKVAESESESESESRTGTECRCGVCVAHGLPVTSGPDYMGRV